MPRCNNPPSSACCPAAHAVSQLRGSAQRRARTRLLRRQARCLLQCRTPSVPACPCRCRILCAPAGSEKASPTGVEVRARTGCTRDRLASDRARGMTPEHRACRGWASHSTEAGLLAIMHSTRPMPRRYTFPPASTSSRWMSVYFPSSAHCKQQSDVSLQNTHRTDWHALQHAPMHVVMMYTAQGTSHVTAVAVQQCGLCFGRMRAERAKSCAARRTGEGAPSHLQRGAAEAVHGARIAVSARHQPFHCINLALCCSEVPAHACQALSTGLRVLAPLGIDRMPRSCMVTGRPLPLLQVHGGRGALTGVCACRSRSRSHPTPAPPTQRASACKAANHRTAQDVARHEAEGGRL